MPDQQYIIKNVTIDPDGNITFEKVLKWFTNDGKYWRKEFHTFREIFEDEPKATNTYSVEQLKTFGMVGLYLEVKIW